MIYNHWNSHVNKIRASVCTLSIKSLYSCEHIPMNAAVTQNETSPALFTSCLEKDGQDYTHTCTHTQSVSHVGNSC